MPSKELPKLNVEQTEYAEGIIPTWPAMNDLQRDAHVNDVRECRNFYIKRMELLLGRRNDDPLDVAAATCFPPDDPKTAERQLQAKLQRDLVEQARARYIDFYDSEVDTTPALQAALKRIRDAEPCASIPVMYVRKGVRSACRSAYDIEVRSL